MLRQKKKASHLDSVNFSSCNYDSAGGGMVWVPAPVNFQISPPSVFSIKYMFGKGSLNGGACY